VTDSIAIANVINELREIIRTAREIIGELPLAKKYALAAEIDSVIPSFQVT
jgi:hypothetical protein